MMRSLPKLLAGFAILSCSAMFCLLNIRHPQVAVAAPAPAHGGPLLTQDFNGTTAWPQLAAPPVAGLTVNAALTQAGTIDEANAVTPSGAAVLTVSGGTGAWTASLISGLLPVHTTETNPGKLTLSFDLSISSVRPVRVLIESFNAKRQRTGGREGMIYPAAADFYQRSALDLSTMSPVGAGTFTPTDPYVRLTWKVSRRPAKAADAAPVAVRVDNVEYASPAFYVRPSGSDANDGRTEATAFASPQKAVDAAQPGDIVLLMDGIYHRAAPNTTQEGIAYFRHGGTPAAWVTLKNYPGQHPLLNSDSWSTIRIGRWGGDTSPQHPALAYIEVRGLHIQGNGLVAKQQFPDDIGKAMPDSNGNGISIDGGNEANVPHHFRFADNLVENCCGGGIGGGDCDWVTIENNVCRDNCWWTIYATSGISMLTTANFDAADNITKDLIRNNVTSGNRCYEKWRVNPPRFSDGNGIIVDSNYDVKHNKVHRGRTLIQNNLSFNNGGSGIHAFKSHRVDIVNNTAYYNGATPELRWGQIFVQLSDDMSMVNNILVSRPDQPINSCGPGGDDQGSTNVVRSNNVYFGGLTPKLTGPGDVVADPQFVNASTEPATADFHVKAGSPALKSGVSSALVPLLDLDGRPRPVSGSPDRGAYQH